MHGNCVISLGFQDICQTILRIPHIKLIRNTSGWQKAHTVSCKSLVFRTGSSGSECRYMKLSMFYIFVKASYVWQNFYIWLYFPYTFKICKTFIHNQDNIFRCYCFRSICSCIINTFFRLTLVCLWNNIFPIFNFLCQFYGFSNRIAFWLLDIKILDFLNKRGNVALFFINTVNLP